MKLYVKKLWSLSPDKYKFITLEKATSEYRKYLTTPQSIYSTKNKSFENWLATEI
jgi:hypothetical protein